MPKKISERMLQASFKEAQRRAEEHTRKYGTPCEARLVRDSSNGAVSIVYDMKHKDGRAFTLCDLRALRIERSNESTE